jgi:hypothetical protein
MAVDFNGESSGTPALYWDNSLPNLDLASLSGFITIAWRHYADAQPGWDSVWQLRTDATSGTTVVMAHAGAPTGKMNVTWWGETSGSQEMEYGSLAMSADTWYSLIHTFDLDNLTTKGPLYVDGTQYSGTGDNTIVGGLRQNGDSLVLGNNNALNGALDGHMADFAIWNALLDAGERAAIDAGVLSPLQIKPESLLFFHPMYNTTQPDIISGVAPTVNGSPNVVAHPPCQQAIIPVQNPINPPRLPALLIPSADVSSVASRDYWGPHVYRRGARV